MKNRVHELRNLLDSKQPFHYRLGSKERNHLRNIRRMLSNAYDDGFIGGESGISPKAIDDAINFLNRLP